jgi:hypothetical protein
MSRVPDFVLSCARLAALTGEELAGRSVLTSFSRSRMRYLTGSSACANSGSVKRGVMCCGQSKPEQDRALDLGFVARRRGAPHQIGVLQVSQFRMRVDLETPAVRVVHQDERGMAVGADIADADVLPVAPEVREEYIRPLSSS